MQQKFLLQILLLAQHVSGTTMPNIRSSRVLYNGCCLWYFVLWCSSCWSGVELRVMCPVCRMLQHPANRTCPSLGAQEYYTVVAACGISCCGVQVAGLVWSWGLCVRSDRTQLVGILFPHTFTRNRTNRLSTDACDHGQRKTQVTNSTR